MKTWIKRTLIGLATASVLLGGLAACGHRAWHGHGWSTMSDADAAQMKARVIERVAGKLDLDEAQKAKLGALADTLREQRKAVAGNAGEPKAELLALIAGPSFDRTRAGAWVSAKATAVTTASPAVINALADFYDSLRPEQQAQVREFVTRGRPDRHGPDGGVGGGGW